MEMRKVVINGWDYTGPSEFSYENSYSIETAEETHNIEIWVAIE